MKNYKGMYHSLYEEQLVAADEDYTDWLEAEFGPRLEDPNWADEEWAKTTLSDLLSECFEDRGLDFDEMCDQCGVDQDTLAELGFKTT